MDPRWIALLTALLPFFTVHLTYLVAAWQELVPWCLPYLDSCTSISATGRHPPASYVFRAGMLPSAVIIMAYWWLNGAWLASLRQEGRTAHLRAMVSLGVVAALGLIAYVTVLGEVGEAWARLRRSGTVLFFSFTFLAQLLLARELVRLPQLVPGGAGLARAMLGICQLLLGLGLVTVIWQGVDGAGYDDVEDAFEWVLSLLLQTNFFLGYLLWRRARWRLQPVSP